MTKLLSIILLLIPTLSHSQQITSWDQMQEVANAHPHSNALVAIAYVETGGNLRKIQPTKSSNPLVGIMQLSLSTARGIIFSDNSVKELYFTDKPTNSEILKTLSNNDAASLAVAASLLNSYVVKYKDLNTAIAAYNLGEGKVRTIRSPHQLPYVKRVNSIITKNKHDSRIY